MNVSLIGYGKMGREIEQLCIKRNHNIHSIIDLSLNNNIKDCLGADVAIEFTQPSSAYENVKYCLEHKIPVVSGTTGWYDGVNELNKYCREHEATFFYSTNYSIGVNLFWKMSQHLAEMMDTYVDYHLGLREIHHDHKKDAPSGTAVTLAEKILEVSHRFNDWKYVIQPLHNQDACIPIYAERTGNVPGTHILEYKSEHDRIILTHEAFSRSGFVKGVVEAAEFVHGKIGVFGMSDLLSHVFGK